MELNKIQSKGKWGDQAELINTNFNKTKIELEKLNNSTVKSRGLFSTVNDLISSVPYPGIGDWAIIGKSIPGPVYRYNGSAWVATGEEGGGAEIPLYNYATKVEVNSISREVSVVSAKSESSNLRVNEIRSLFSTTAGNGYFIVDESLNIALKLDDDGLDVAKISEHFINLIKLSGIGSSGKAAGMYETVEPGFYIIDADGNVGFRITDEGIDFTKIGSLLIESLMKSLAVSGDSAINTDTHIKSLIYEMFSADFNDKKLKWCAIGDSFTYLNDHLNETGNRLHKGYVTRTAEKLPYLEVTNIGINGAKMSNFIDYYIPEADIYTILLGTNDWQAGVKIGTVDSFKSKTSGTILGNLGIIIGKCLAANAHAKVVVLNPVERGDFVYILPNTQNALGSYQQYGGQWLYEVSDAIYTTIRDCKMHNVYALDLHTESRFTINNVVKYKRCRVNGEYQNLVYPDYVGITHSPSDEYSYPLAAEGLTYDGLHPSDRGSEVIACLLSEKIKECLTT